MGNSTAVSTLESTYTPQFEPVKMVTIQLEKEVPVIHTPVVTPVKRKPRMIAHKGESQEVIDAILNKFPPIMVEVARCESGLDPLASRKGIDVGLFQINQIHLPEVDRMGLDRLDLHDNLTFANVLYSQKGLQPWYMSEHCWGRYT